MVKERLLLVGGGSGGHITPLLAIVKALKKQTDYEIRLWCDQKTLTTSRSLFGLSSDVKVEKIIAGKFRRYHHLKWWQHLGWSIFWPNFKDVFKLIGGVVQSLIKLIIWRPKLIFAKGGYVCLPVGLVARLLGIRLVIHDSDTLPGLTNRILSKLAVRIATGFPTEYYVYPKEKTTFTGIPIQPEYQPISPNRQVELKEHLKLSGTQPLVVIIGGGLGAKCLNQVVVSVQHQLTQKFSVVLATGEGGYNEVVKQIVTPVVVRPFFNNLYQYILASDLVVCRAGATTLAELAASRKLSIVVPNPKLTGGHQLKNAEVLERAQAAVVLDEKMVSRQPEQLVKTITQLLQDRQSETTQKMLDNFYQLARPRAAEMVAELISNEIGAQKR